MGRKTLSKNLGIVSGNADVSIIIVNYDTADMVLETSASVLVTADHVRDVHIVDKASPVPYPPGL